MAVGRRKDRGTGRTDWKAEAEMREAQSMKKAEADNIWKVMPERVRLRDGEVTSSGSHSRQLQSHLSWHNARLQTKQGKSY